MPVKSTITFKETDIKMYTENVMEEMKSSLVDDFTKEMDRLILLGVTKEAYLSLHEKNVKSVFKTLYPDTNLTSEQIRLIVLMWEEQVDGDKTWKSEQY